MTDRLRKAAQAAEAFMTDYLPIHDVKEAGVCHPECSPCAIRRDLHFALAATLESVAPAGYKCLRCDAMASEKDYVRHDDDCPGQLVNVYAALAEPKPQGEPVAWGCMACRYCVTTDPQDYARLNFGEDGHQRGGQRDSGYCSGERHPLFATPPDTVPVAVAERMAAALEGIADTVPGDGWLPQGIQEAYRATARKALAAYREAVR